MYVQLLKNILRFGVFDKGGCGWHHSCSDVSSNVHYGLWRTYTTCISTLAVKLQKNFTVHTVHLLEMGFLQFVRRKIINYFLSFSALAQVRTKKIHCFSDLIALHEIRYLDKLATYLTISIIEKMKYFGKIDWYNCVTRTCPRESRRTLMFVQFMCSWSKICQLYRLMKH